ncbi:MAG TPA: MBL fold metallo-hydrolase [Candidatus Solibacter sp.]|nr:MBL fold metallo-hydrolase [Candidatus Solibacter sp.]
MRLTLCGVRGSSPASGREFDRYGGHTSCLAVSPDGGAPTLILDAGTGITGVTRLLGGEPFQGTILFGHLHWDHTQGLPFFSGGDNPGSRVTVAVPAQGDTEAVLERMMSPPHFPITPRQLRGDWSFVGLDPGEHSVEGLSVRAIEVPHKGGRMFGYRIGDGLSTFAYISDHGPIDAGPGPEGLGEYHPAIMDLAEGVDLLIHDAQYTVEEFQGRSHFGHSAVDYTVNLGLKAGAKKLLLFHHDPSHSDDKVDQILAHALELRGDAAMEIESAAEGGEIQLA